MKIEIDVFWEDDHLPRIIQMLGGINGLFEVKPYIHTVRMGELHFHPQGNESFFRSLPTTVIPGFADQVDGYIRAWESGGGSPKVADALIDALLTYRETFPAEEDIPLFLANALYLATSSVCTLDEEAYQLVLSACRDSLQELGEDVSEIPEY